ncbi:MAG: hypothetical protein ACR2KS_10235 [Candidatus Eremiobacter antarcticus]
MKTKIDWAKARDEYVAGTESYATIARRLGCAKNLIERHALNRGANGGRTWGQARAAFQTKASAKTLERAADRAGQIAQLRLEVAYKALQRLAQRIGDSDFCDRDLVATAKLGVPTQLEVTGAEGRPLLADTTLAPLDEFTRSAVDAALEAALRSQLVKPNGESHSS